MKSINPPPLCSNGFATATLWLVQKTTHETPLYSPILFGRICRYSGDYSRRVHKLSVCESSPGLKPMLGFKRFHYVAVTISGIELMQKIQKRQFKIGKLARRPATWPEIWAAALAS